ncbi:MAG: HPr(Ser) kinase/phosphatase [Gemmatimonadota bacterium]
MKTLTVEEFFRAKRSTLALELLTDGRGLSRTIDSSSVSSPGLVLAGYTDRFPTGRIQVLGETEVSYLHSRDAKTLRDLLATFFGLDMAAVVISKGQETPPAMVELARGAGVALFRSRLKTGELFRRIQSYLAEQLAESTTMHGSLADVYGVGLLFVGRSGIGKSECVLDLVERGHRLVADDLVYITRRGNEILIGRSHELQRHHMEIRGVGIIDIPALFGIRAIRQQKRIEVVVQLEEWSDEAYYDRTGLEADEVEVLGVNVPKVIVPLNPGKNITVISEVVALNHLLRYSGVQPAVRFNRRLQEAMRPVRDYLEEDYE